MFEEQFIEKPAERGGLSLAEKFESYKADQFELAEVNFLELGIDFQEAFEKFLNKQISLKEAQALRDNGQVHNQSEIFLIGHILNVLIDIDSAKKLQDLNKEKNPYVEIARWLESLIQNGEGGYHLGDGTEIIYREVDPLIWQLTAEFRRGDFNDVDGTENYLKRLSEVKEGLGREPNDSEGVIIGFLGNKTFVISQKAKLAKEIS